MTKSHGPGSLPYPHPATETVTLQMRANKRKDTRPEVAIRQSLHALGLRFRKDMPLRCGSHLIRPDIVFTRKRVAVFVDGCFWHCCPEHFRAPSRNLSYWEPKLARNVERDRAQDAALAAVGWTVVRIWEHETPSDAAALVADAVA
jgi:DNA mismatch endonuclease, patch repair protein